MKTPGALEPTIPKREFCCTHWCPPRPPEIIIYIRKSTKRDLGVHFCPGPPGYPKCLPKGECFAPFGSSGLATKHRSGVKSPRQSSEAHSFTQSNIARGVKVGSSGLAIKHRSGGKCLRRSPEEHLFSQSNISRGVKLGYIGATSRFLYSCLSHLPNSSRAADVNTS